MKRRRLPWALAAALLLLFAGCGRSSPPPSDLDWMLGDWHGVRRDGTDGTKYPMTAHIESIGGGTGQVERLEVAVEPAPYVGLAVRTPARGGAGRWTMIYANSTRQTFARLEGEAGTARVTWRSVTPGRTDESRTEVERLGADRWRRTHSVSDDGGATWRVLFTDEMERDP